MKSSKIAANCRRKSNSSALACMVLGALLCTYAFGWSGKGHGVLTEYAFSRLAPEVRTYYVNLAGQLKVKEFAPLAAEQRLTYLGQWPDDIRKQTLGTLFRDYGTKLPAALNAYRKRDSAPWHYHNTVVKNAGNQHCTFDNPGLLLRVLPVLDQTLGTALTPQQELLLLGLQLHFIEDLHQPLHTFTRLDGACQSDLGGNRTCVKPGSGGQCEMNLHWLWDNGFGQFDQLAKTLAQMPLLAVNAYRFEPEAWLQEGLEFYALAYSPVDKTYQARAERIVGARLRLASQRLIAYLERHYSRQHHLRQHHSRQ